MSNTAAMRTFCAKLALTAVIGCSLTLLKRFEVEPLLMPRTPPVPIYALIITASLTLLKRFEVEPLLMPRTLRTDCDSSQQPSVPMITHTVSTPVLTCPLTSETFASKYQRSFVNGRREGISAREHEEN